MQTVARLTVPAQPEYLSVCRLALAGVTAEMRISDRVLDDLKLVLSEMCANAIEHGYEGSDGDIEIEFRTSDREIEVSVADRGAGPSAARYSAPGVGFSLLHKLCSRADVRSRGDGPGTIVTFARAFPA